MSILKNPVFWQAIGGLFMALGFFYIVFKDRIKSEESSLSKKRDSVVCEKLMIKHKSYINANQATSLNMLKENETTHRRMGKQVDKHDEIIDKHTETLAAIREGLAFLVGKQDGDPGKMGLK